MACDCIETIDAKLANHNSKLEIGFTLRGDGDEPGQVFPALRTEKINKRSRERMGVVPTYCPFCGTKYREPPNA
jgi:hypothetical protein